MPIFQTLRKKSTIHNLGRCPAWILNQTKYPEKDFKQQYDLYMWAATMWQAATNNTSEGLPGGSIYNPKTGYNRDAIKQRQDPANWPGMKGIQPPEFHDLLIKLLSPDPKNSMSTEQASIYMTLINEAATRTVDNQQTLDTHLNKMPNVAQQKNWDFRSSLVQDLKANFHDKGLAHGRINTGNIRFGDDGNVVDKQQKVLGGPRLAKTEININMAAPEIHKEGNESRLASDTWSLGLSLFMEATGMTQFPWEAEVQNINKDNTMEAHGKLAKAKESLKGMDFDQIDPPEYGKLLKSMMNPDPQQRPPIEKVAKDIESYSESFRLEQAVLNAERNSGYNL